MRYAYPCNIVRDEEEERASGREAYVVTFPDVYGANTGGWSREEALEMAKDCLGVALGMYVKEREVIPTPSPLEEGQVLVSVAPIVAAKLALHTAMREQGITNVALAARLGSAGERGPPASRYRAPFPHYVGRKGARSCWALPGRGG